MPLKPGGVKFDIPENVIKNWQEIVDLIAILIKVPAALIMRLNEPSIEVFVSSQSGGNPYHPGDSEHFDGSGLYCETVIKTKNRLLVPDAREDENWKNNPDIKLNMISYLGFPLFLPGKKPFGTICVLDKKSNAYSGTVEKLMMKFRDVIESSLELIYVNRVLGDRNKKLSDYVDELKVLRGLVTICASCKSIKDAGGRWHPIEDYITRDDVDFSHGICPKCMARLSKG